MNGNSMLNGFLTAALLSVSIVAMADVNTQIQSKNVGVAITDSAITAKIKAMYMNEPALKESDISVTTANGIVTLTGSAPTTDAKDSADRLAKTVDGVVSVNSMIQTPSIVSKVETKTKSAANKTERVVSDSWITTKVKSMLLADSVTKGLSISVETIHHIVILSGTVNTQAAIDHAVAVAKRVKGVDSVDATSLKVVG